MQNESLLLHMAIEEYQMRRNWKTFVRKLKLAKRQRYLRFLFLVWNPPIYRYGYTRLIVADEEPECISQSDEILIFEDGQRDHCLRIDC